MNKRASVLLSVLLALVVTSVAPLAAGAGGQAPVPRRQAAKIAPDLRQALEVLPAGERLSVIVTFVEQADLRPMGSVDRAKRQEHVVRALRQTAQATQAPFRALLQERHSLGHVDRFTFFWIFNGLAMTATPDVILELASRPEVRSIMPDRVFTAPSPSTTTAAAVVSGTEENLILINAPALWDLGFQGQGVVVANMDTGVSVSHPDLSARWRGGTNSWFDPYGEHPSSPVDPNGHGTATMGIMVGGDAGGTHIGVAPLAQWIAVKIFDDRGQATSSAIHLGFQWLLDPDGDPLTPDGPHVVNNSWRIGNTDCDLAFQLDLQALRAAGIVPVFSAGNTGPYDATSVSPANNPEALAVGATDKSDLIYAGSARGPSACGELPTFFPEVVAPGVDIRTAGRFASYQTVTGTSMAAPHVAGALALLLSAYPNLTISQQEAALLNGVVDLGPLGVDNTYGYGRIDVLAAFGHLPDSAYLSVTLSASPDPVESGATLTYTMVITNSGPASSGVVTVTDALPAGVIYGDAAGEGWCCGHLTGVVTCTRSGLAMGAAAAVTITVTAPSASGTVTNTVVVSGQASDPDITNNVASVTTRVRRIYRTYLPTVLRCSTDTTVYPEIR
ncbi:MAG: S8 family serine peptidase [Anaerolineae bacterium]|nr:S8 family serine peptidase [Anaerolineae bacterium]